MRQRRHIFNWDFFLFRGRYNNGTIRFTVFGFENACMAERVENQILKKGLDIPNNLWASVGLIAVVPAGWQRWRSSPANFPTHNYLVHSSSVTVVRIFFFLFLLSTLTKKKKEHTYKQTKLFFYFLRVFFYVDFLFPFLLASVRCRSLCFLSYLNIHREQTQKG